MSMKVPFMPGRGRLLVAPALAEEKTSGGIIIPDTAKERPKQGKVVAVGKSKEKEPMDYEVGTEVLYSSYSGTEVKVKGSTYLVIPQSDILGSFEK